MDLISRGEAQQSSKLIGEIDGHSFYNSSYSNFPKQELAPPDTDYARERNNAINNNSKDGVKPMTKEEQEFERALNWQLIKKFTMSIFKMDVTRFSFPVGYNEPRTFLERSADLFGFLTQQFLPEAARESDPAKRIARVAAGVCAGYHLYLQQKKPWNPVLGETYIGRWENGATIYGEQVSHHPPISRIQITDPAGAYSVSAGFNFIIDTGIKQIDIIQKGETRLEFSDGTVYQWEFPTIAVTGLLSGDRIVKVKNRLVIKDEKNGIAAVVDVNPKENKAKGIVKPRQTTLYGGVCKLDSDMKKLQELSVVISGDYCDSIKIDDEVVWNIATDTIKRPMKEISDDELLLSDCRFRIDRAYLIQGDMEKADMAKTIIEECQRHDYKIRDGSAKKKK